MVIRILDSLAANSQEDGIAWIRADLSRFHDIMSRRTQPTGDLDSSATINQEPH
jgi:hypothetical protein